MELSTEDRERVFQEEKAKREAQEKPTSEKRAKSTKHGCLFLFGLFVVFCIISVLTPKSKPSHESSTGIGAVASISYNATCAPSYEALTRIMENMGSETQFLSTIGVEARGAGWAGPVFLAPPDRVKVLEKSGDKARVRIVEMSGSSSLSAVLEDNQRECWVLTKAID